MRKTRFIIFLLIGALTANSFALTEPTQAIDARTYNAGRIIDDAIFTNTSSMSTVQIQAFLNSKVPNCGIAVCLKSYRQNVQTGADNYGGAPNPAGSMSAAEIIKMYTDQFSINPQVILATLQKEKGLVTSTAPSLKLFQEAMGYGCPDNRTPGTPACNPATGSFSAQIYQGARHFRGYFDAPAGWWVTYRPGVHNIPFNPNGGCGSSAVNIQNRATASLYTYTPYQPNQAALNAGYGSSPDGCSSYGNRNFYLFFSDWFGSTIADCQPGEPLMGQVQRIYNPTTYEHFYSPYQCEINVLSQRHGFQPIGAAYNTTTSPTVAVPVHRLYNPVVKVHFWTISSSESAALQQRGYHYEGVAFHVVSPEVPSAQPVYREYNPTTGVHFWTLSLSEADHANRYAGYRFEGIAFYSQ